MDRIQIAANNGPLSRGNQPSGAPAASPFSSWWMKATVVGVAGMLSLVALLGCEDRSPPAPPAATPPPSPEVRWEQFLTEFRRRLGSDPGGSFSYGGRDTYYADYKIKSAELIPPESENGVYRGKLVIETKSSFTVYDDGNDQGDSTTEKTNKPADAGDKAELEEILGIDVATETGGRPRLKAPLQTREDVEETVCDLAYVENRWVLKTELDPETSTFLKAAFRLALERQ